MPVCKRVSTLGWECRERVNRINRGVLTRAGVLVSGGDEIACNRKKRNQRSVGNLKSDIFFRKPLHVATVRRKKLPKTTSLHQRKTRKKKRKQPKVQFQRDFDPSRLHLDFQRQIGDGTKICFKTTTRLLYKGREIYKREDVDGIDTRNGKRIGNGLQHTSFLTKDKKELKIKVTGRRELETVEVPTLIKRRAFLY
mmetsp:Transcript_8632/g.15936  ORF Transcript_8632/g.15936 Transcript_8632/m.15936 type:complete len:196 (+) Transcript_8632:230-817(+)